MIAARARGGVERPVFDQHGQIVEIQRARLLAAAIAAVDELGYGQVTVGDITARARMSRRTFYELFANGEECLAAVLEDVVEMLALELAAADLKGLQWRERVRRGLWVMLSFFDREPALARVCVIGALAGGPAVLERREQLLGLLAGVVDEGRLVSQRGAACTPLTAEGVVGAAFTIVHARLLRDVRARSGRSGAGRLSLTALLGELMGLIVLPYLGPAAARREQARPAPVRVASKADAVAAGRATDDPLDGVEMRLTYRTAKVLEALVDAPGANNRQVAERAGIRDQGQVSKLLSRLQGLGLLANDSEGHAKGEPNAWSLTAKGRRVARSINTHVAGRQAAA